MMTKRCKHVHCIAREEIVLWREYFFNEELPDGGYNPEGDITGKYTIDCEDCGRRWNVNYYSKYPKWMQRFFDHIMKKEI